MKIHTWVLAMPLALFILAAMLVTLAPTPPPVWTVDIDEVATRPSTIKDLPSMRSTLTQLLTLPVQLFASLPLVHRVTDRLSYQLHQAAQGAWQRHRDRQRQHMPPPTFLTVQHVPDCTLPHPTRTQKPVVLTGCTLAESLGPTWSIQHMAASKKRARFTLGQVYQRPRATQSTFMYAETSKPLQQAPNLDWSHIQHETIYDMPLGMLMDLVVDDPTRALYYSGPLDEQGAPPALVTQAQQAVEGLTMRETVAESGRTGGLSMANLWVGSKTAHAHLHYDAVHNLFLQVQGTKRFRLVPARAYRSMRLFPGLHPSDRQAQLIPDRVQWNIPARGHDATTETEDVYEVILQEGQVLYVPPFWFHDVLALNTSLSLNVWSECGARLRMDPLFDNLMPYWRQEWAGTEQGVLIMQHWLPRILGAVVTESTNPDATTRAAAFLYDMLVDQWLPLAEKMTKTTVEESDREAVRTTLLTAFPMPTALWCSDSKAHGLEELLDPHVRDAAGVFARINEPAKSILLTQFIESSLHHALGEAAAIPSFVLECVLQ